MYPVLLLSVRAQHGVPDSPRVTHEDLSDTLCIDWQHTQARGGALDEERGDAAIGNRSACVGCENRGEGRERTCWQ